MMERTRTTAKQIRLMARYIGRVCSEANPEYARHYAIYKLTEIIKVATDEIATLNKEVNENEIQRTVTGDGQQD